MDNLTSSDLDYVTEEQCLTSCASACSSFSNASVVMPMATNPDLLLDLFTKINITNLDFNGFRNDPSNNDVISSAVALLSQDGFIDKLTSVLNNEIPFANILNYPDVKTLVDVFLDTPNGENLLKEIIQDKINTLKANKV